MYFRLTDTKVLTSRIFEIMPIIDVDYILATLYRQLDEGLFVSNKSRIQGSKFTYWVIEST
jgi:hypothetical protein